MTQDPLYATLETLRSEREGAEHDANELSQKLQAISQRLTHLRGAIENIEALLGVASVEDEAVLGENLDNDEDSSTGVAARVVDFTNVEDGPRYEPAAKKRVPSTVWVAEVVERLGRPVDRNEIFKAFRHYKNFPDSWTNPRNSVNNALARAVERDLVLKIDDNLFAPIKYNPFGSDDEDREGS